MVMMMLVMLARVRVGARVRGNRMEKNTSYRTFFFEKITTYT